MKGGLLLNKFFKGIGFYLVIFIIIVGIVQFSGKPTQKVETLEFSKVYRELTNENISRLYFVSDTAVEGTIKDSNTKFRSYVPKEIMGDTLSKEVLDQAREGKIVFGGEAKPSTPWFVELLPTLLLIFFMVILWFVFMNQSQGGGGRVMNFGKSKAKVHKDDEKTRVTFKEVAGLNEEKEDLQEVVDFLKNPKKYIELGARIPKGILMVGPPGTGKTYDVPELAVRLCDPDFKANEKGRDELMERYNQLKQEKRIAFTTFHQSMDYEDWIEGIRPLVNDNNQITYEVEKGIFKQLCEDAERPVVKDKQAGIADNAVVWKVSLMGTGHNPVRTDCMENNYIRIGWDEYGAVISDETDWSIYNGEGKQILDAFINKMKEGDIVMSCFSNQTIDAVGVVTGDYEYLDSLPDYKRVRRVNWILKGINENIVDMNDGKTLTLGTVYRLNSITLDKVKTLLDKYKKPTTMESNTKPYVMVIDEMNRGNVSKIFGELITLLEIDKRKGRKNAENVILPYSKKMFQIPENVYIIATMNTADRSLGSLDYAIRRRFAFIADKPISLEDDVPGFNADLFKMVSQLFISNYEEYEESEWLQSFKLLPAYTLSEEYRPEDVWIGHSYFIMKDENGDDNTSDRLLYEIIPLLEEYVRDGVLTGDAQATIDELYQIAIE